MNKKQLRQAVEIAIQDSNQEDAKRVRARGDLDYRVSNDRLRAFLSYFAGTVSGDCPEAGALISDFLRQVNWDTNPLLDAADSNKEKPE